MVAAAQGRVVSWFRRRRGRSAGRGGPTLGGYGRVSRRWEMGAPLIVMGGLVAYLTIDVEGGQAFFWGGVVVAGIGLSLFLSPR